MIDQNFWKGKRVFLTGHTGFKGSWLSLWLTSLGATVKGYVIKEYFANYFLHQSDVTFCMKKNSMKVHQKRAEPWTITLVDTGDNSRTGGRLSRVSEYVKNEEAFCFTYGDGVSDVNITKLIEFHKKHGKDATLTSVYPPGRFGALDIKDNQIKQFTEKPKGDGALINGVFLYFLQRFWREFLVMIALGSKSH